jgi:hypothetical protein
MKYILKKKSTYATITTSSPKEELLWYGALSPAAQIDAYDYKLGFQLAKINANKPPKRIKKGRGEIQYRQDRRTARRNRGRVQVLIENPLPVDRFLHFLSSSFVPLSHLFSEVCCCWEILIREREDYTLQLLGMWGLIYIFLENYKWAQ